MKQQVIVIHGGDMFDTYEQYLAFLNAWKIDIEDYRNSGFQKWNQTLGKALGDEYEVIRPDMPNKMNAKYVEWKIWFEKFVPSFNDDVVLVGHSLGGTFLAKYLGENILPKKIRAVFLVAACYDAQDADYPMGDFNLPESLEKLSGQTSKIFLYHSTDDPVVPFADLAKFQRALPHAITRVFDDRNHFRQEQFPELVGDIKSLS